MPTHRSVTAHPAAANRDVLLGLGLVGVFAAVVAATSAPLDLASGPELARVGAVAVGSAVASLAAAAAVWGRRGPRWLVVFPVLLVVAQAVLGTVTSGVAANYVGFVALAIIYVGVTQPPAVAPPFVVVAAVGWLLSQDAVTARTYMRLAILVSVWCIVGTTLASRVARDRARAHELAARANTDTLTGLASRLALTSAIECMLRRDGEAVPSVVLLIDLDGFKAVNDMFGHAAGDELLVTIARRLRATTRPGDLCARLGGDEFAVLLSGATTTQATAVAERMLARLSEPIPLSRGQMAVTASIGVAALDGASNADEALRDADLAMYAAKADGRNRISTFERELGERRDARLMLEAELHRALEADQFELYYQPVVHLRTGAVIGVEALVRWNHPVRGVLSPDQFLTTSEEIGVIVELGEWVLREACAQAVRWQPDDPARAVSIAVNLSGPELLAKDFVTRLGAVLESTGLPPRLLLLEVSERLVASDAPLIRHRIDETRALGVRIAIDDFGTGHSSLAYLRDLPVDILKIDRSFVQSIGVDRQSTALVKSIIAIADALQLDTIAEGVEEPEQVEILTSLGCDIAQGYHFCPPRPAAVAAEILRPRPTYRSQ